MPPRPGLRSADGSRFAVLTDVPCTVRDALHDDVRGLVTIKKLPDHDGGEQYVGVRAAGKDPLRKFTGWEVAVVGADIFVYANAIVQLGKTWSKDLGVLLVAAHRRDPLRLGSREQVGKWLAWLQADPGAHGRRWLEETA